MSTEIERLPTCESVLTGTQFQDVIIPRLESLKRNKQAAIDRPGVHAVPIGRFPDGTVRARLIQSLPDFQGVYGVPQTETIFDPKVCSQASFDLSKYRIESRKPRSRQLRHMYERASFGSTCFFLIHWNTRQLKSKTVPPITYAFPVREDHPFWEAFESGAEKSIKQSHCETYAVEVPWTTEGQERIPRPDIMFAIEKVAKMNRGRRVGGW